jgi:predicted neuraminidase
MVLASGLLKSVDGMRWTLHGNLTAFVPKQTPGSTNGLCEPSIVQFGDGEILMILRSGDSRHWESRSLDSGVTWSAPRPSALVGHNTPTALWRLEEARDEIIAVWNNSPVNRFPLTVALSADRGKTFTAPRTLANPIGYQVSYPGVTQAKDRTIVAVWQQQLPDGGRDIRYARFTRDWVRGVVP